MCIFTSNDQSGILKGQSLAIRQLLDKAFIEYNMHKVYTFVFAENKDEVKLMKRAHLKDEAVFKREAIDSNGRYVDVIRMMILAEDYKKTINEQI